MLLHVSVLHSFLLPNNIALYGYTIFYLFIHQLIDIWVFSTFWLLWMILLWRFMYGFLCVDICIHISWLYTILCSHQQCMRVPISPYCHQHLLLLVFLCIVILVAVKRHLIRVLFCFSLLVNDIEYLFMCLYSEFLHLREHKGQLP